MLHTCHKSYISFTNDVSQATGYNRLCKIYPIGLPNSPMHCTTRVTMHTCYMYCCHNARVDRRDFKFSVLKFKNS